MEFVSTILWFPISSFQFYSFEKIFLVMKNDFKKTFQCKKMYPNQCIQTNHNQWIRNEKLLSVWKLIEHWFWFFKKHKMKKGTKETAKWRTKEPLKVSIDTWERWTSTEQP